MALLRSITIVIVVNFLLIILLMTGYRGVHIYQIDANGNISFSKKFNWPVKSRIEK